MFILRPPSDLCAVSSSFKKTAASRHEPRARRPPRSLKVDSNSRLLRVLDWDPRQCRRAVVSKGAMDRFKIKMPSRWLLENPHSREAKNGSNQVGGRQFLPVYPTYFEELRSRCTLQKVAFSFSSSTVMSTSASNDMLTVEGGSPCSQTPWPDYVEVLSPVSSNDAHVGIRPMTPVPFRPGFTLSWSNVTFSVPTKAKKAVKSGGDPSGKRVILKNVSGRCAAGELTAVMGPSGSGKTTLLDILADRVRSGELEGSIEVNGTKRDPSTFRAIASYVAQEDTLLGSFTVRETLVMAAKLGLPSAVTNAMIYDRVETALGEMGLCNCANTVVGDVFRKGISGGQKRRLSMAIELLSNPSILLLDEPTSGLDSAATYNIIKLIQKLCRDESKTVICTIHQPSSLVYEMFSNIVILSAGETVYCGARADMILHFALTGYDCPEYSNPAEYCIELVNADFEGHGDIRALITAFEQSAISKALSVQIDKDRAGGAKPIMEPKHHKEKVSPWRQFLVLLQRNSLNNMRNPGIFWVRVVMYTALATMFGTIFLYTNKNVSDNDISVLFFGAHAFFVFMSVAVVPFFVEERAVFLRERVNSSLNVLSFVVANFIAAIPGILAMALIVSCLIVFPAGLNCFGYYLLNVFLSMLVAESMMRVVGAAVPHGIIGLAIGASIFGFFMLCEGFMVPKHSIPDYWIWGHYLAFHTYAFQTFMHKQFMPYDENAPVPAILTRMGLTDVQPDRNMGILVGYAIGLEMIFATIVYFVHTGRR